MVDDPNKTENGMFMEDDFLAADEPATEAGRQKVNIKEILERNPMLKVVGIVGGIIFLLLAYMVFGGDSGKPDPSEEISSVRSTPDVSQVPGTVEPPPAYEEALRQSNEQIAKRAEMTGESAIPTPIARPSERIEAPVQVEENDPLSEWRREAETRRIERQQQEEDALKQQQEAIQPPPLPVDQQQNAQNAQPAPPPLPTAPSVEQIQAMQQQLQQQMQTILETQIPKDSVLVSMSGIQPGYDMKKYFPEQAAQGTGGAGQTANGQPGTVTPVSTTAAKPPKPLIPAGTIAYAQIITEANSDVPGPVLAEIASGPLLGGRAIGTFSVAQRHLVLQFTRVVKDGVEYSTQAFALDPATTLPGVVTQIDNHYFSRIFLPAAAAFIQGFADAATQRDTEVVVSNGTVVTSTNNDLDTRQELLKGAREAGSKLADVVDENAERPRTIIVHAGTRIGLLFMSAVVDPAAMQQQMANQQQQGGYGQALFNATPYGQAYNAYQAYQGQQQNPGYGSYGASQQQGLPQGLYSSQNTPMRMQPF